MSKKEFQMIPSSTLLLFSKCVIVLYEPPSSQTLVPYIGGSWTLTWANSTQASVTRKKSPNVYKSFPNMISLEKDFNAYSKIA